MAKPISMTRARELIKQTIDALDIEGLLKLGAPNDEYLGEVYMYANYAVDNDSINAKDVKRLWIERFTIVEDECSLKYYDLPHVQRGFVELTDTIKRVAEELRDE
jgi:hypothetical protein